MTGCLARRAQTDASSEVVVINSMKTRRSAESADMSRVFRRIRLLHFLLHFPLHFRFRATSRRPPGGATQGRTGLDHFGRIAIRGTREDAGRAVGSRKPSREEPG